MTITFIIKISCSTGFIRWVELYSIYIKDKELKNNFKKNPKPPYLALLPGNKQNVRLALARNNNYGSSKLLSKSKRCCQFFKIFNTWWTISNSKKRFSPNILRNAVINGGKKTEFLRALADWIEEKPQTAPTLTTTFCAHAVLIDELLRLISL